MLHNNIYNNIYIAFYISTWVLVTHYNYCIIITDVYRLTFTVHTVTTSTSTCTCTCIIHLIHASSID